MEIFVVFLQRVLGDLYRKIQEMEPQINQALKEDPGKSAFESHGRKVGMTLSEITHMKKHVKKYATPNHVKGPLQKICSGLFGINNYSTIRVPPEDRV